MRKRPIVLSNGTNDSRMRNFLHYPLCLMLFCPVLLGRSAGAQSTGQQFVGNVADAGHAVVAGATVTIHNENTGEETVVQTTRAGDYTAPYLKPGIYSVTADKAGFKTVSKTHISLDIDKTSKIDFVLPVGSVSETVTVSDEGTQIELSKADRGDILDAERVQELPTDGRNALMLTGLSPGVRNNENPQFTRMADNVGQQLFVNGIKDAVVAENLDGATNDTGNNFTGYVPPIDSVSEFKVVVNPYDASYGRSGGGAVDISLKSGTNRLHGDAYEYARRAWLDANSFQNDYNFTKPGGGVYAKPNHKRDLYGFEADGPVRIPFLYNGSDKTFFTVQYEESKENLPNTGATINSIPNPAWTTGNFAGATYYDNVTQTVMPLIIYDPLSPLVSAVDPHDGKTKLTRTPFPGNIIPQNRLDPVGVALAQIYNGITPNNNPGAGVSAFQNNLYNIGIEYDLSRIGLIKLDQNFGPKDRGTLRWGGEERYANKNQNGVPDNNIGNQTFHQRQPKSQTFALDEVHTFSPTIILDNKISILTQQQGLIPGTGQTRGNFLPGLGFSQHFQDNVFRHDMIPDIQSSGYIELGNGGPGSYNDAHTLAYQPSVTLVRGRHTVRVGLDMRLQQYAQPGGGNNTAFTFNGGYTAQFYDSSDAASGYNAQDAPGYQSGNSIASLVLGLPSGGGLQFPASPFFSQHYYAMWAQDDWKITPKLTLNLGIRYDLLGARTERHNVLNYAFNQTALSPIDAQITNRTALINPLTGQPYGPIVGGVQFAGVNGNPRGAYATNLLNIQPRFGAAYAFSSRTSLRAGFGEMFINNESNDSRNGFQSNTGYTSSLDNGVTPYGHLSDPFPATVKPTGTSLGLATTPDGTINFTYPHYQVPSLWEYSVSLQQLLTKHDSLEISYSGTRAYNLPGSIDINHISPAWNAQCDVERVGYNPAGGTANAPRQLCDGSAGQVTNPFYQVPAFLGTGYYTSSKISGSNLTRPFPAYTAVSQDNSPQIHQWYNSLQVVASHNVSRSLSLHFAYTWSKTMTTGFIFDQIDSLHERRLASNDIPTALSLSGVYYLPVGRGKAFLGHTNRLVDALVGGWEVAPLYTYSQGVPWSPGTNWEVMGPVGIHSHDLQPTSTQQYKRLQGVSPCVGYKDTDTGAIHAGPTYTQAGCTSYALVRTPNQYALQHNVIYYGVRLQAFHEFDASVSKSFAYNEKLRLQTRLDAFNIPNHPNFNGNYNTDPTSADWGSIRKGPDGPGNPPRYLQLSGKLIF